MNPTTPKLRLIYLAAIVMCTVLSSTGARGDDKSPAPLKVAVVNLGRLLNEYKFTVEADQKLKKKQDEIVTELNSWDQHRLLTEPEQHSLGSIAIKEGNKIELTPTEKATKTRLEDAHKVLFTEFLNLQQNKMPTPTEEARLRTLSNLESETQKRIKERQTLAQTELKKEAEDDQIKMDKDVHDAIAKVAKAKGFNIVFSNQVVFYAENDITDDVLKDLNSAH